MSQVNNADSSNKNSHPQRAIFIPRVFQWLMRKTLRDFKKQIIERNEQLHKNQLFDEHTQDNDLQGREPYEENNYSINFKKIEGLVDSFLSRQTSDKATQQSPSLALCPKVRNLPYWNEGDSSFFDGVSDDLSLHFETLLSEYLQNSQSGPLEKISNTYQGELNDKKWNRYVLAPNMSFGKFNKQAEKQFPLTTAHLKSYGNRLASAAFYAMEPGVVLPPHTDSTNFFIVSHTGIKVPENCAFEVKDEIRELNKSKTVFFDQSFTHSAWNKGDDTRVTLVLFFVHPDITTDEVNFLLAIRDKVKMRAIILAPFIGLELLLNKLSSKTTKT